MSFLGKVVIVTGAASGMGAATAEKFAKEGARVALVDKDEANLAQVAQRCRAHGAQALAIRADLAHDHETNTIVKTTVDTFKQLDILVNAAGFFITGTLLDGNIIKAFDAVMKVNLRAPILLTTLAAPYLVQSKGNVVNISSIGSFVVPILPYMAPYNISKGALDDFTRMAASELASANVRVNSVNPGFVRTNFEKNGGVSNELACKIVSTAKGVGLGKICEPEEIADLILFLASDKAKSVTGSCYVIDNGCMVNQTEF